MTPTGPARLMAWTSGSPSPKRPCPSSEAPCFPHQLANVTWDFTQYRETLTTPTRQSCSQPASSFPSEIVIKIYTINLSELLHQSPTFYLLKPYLSAIINHDRFTSMGARQGAVPLHKFDSWVQSHSHSNIADRNDPQSLPHPIHIHRHGDK